jgi:hypothetical protein
MTNEDEGEQENEREWNAPSFEMREKRRPIRRTTVGVPGTVQFDPYGLPLGKASGTLWNQILVDLDQELEAKGWNQPASFYAICNKEVSNWLKEAPSNELPEDNVSITPALKGGTGPLAILTLRHLENEPLDELWGYDAPHWAGGLILVSESLQLVPRDNVDFEGTDVSDVSIVNASLRLIEARILILATRGGERHMLIHVRGEATYALGEDEDHSWDTGFIPEVMARCLGLPPIGNPRKVSEYLGIITLLSAREIPRRFKAVHEGRSDFLTEDRRSLPPEALREMRSLSPEDVRELISQMTVSAAVGKMDYIVKHILGGDPITSRDISSRAPGMVKKLVSGAREVGDLTWSQFAALDRALLPDDAPDQEWGGETLYSQVIVDRLLPTQAELLKEIEQEITSDAFTIIRQLCMSARWLTPDI